MCPYDGHVYLNNFIYKVNKMVVSCLASILMRHELPKRPCSVYWSSPLLLNVCCPEKHRMIQVSARTRSTAPCRFNISKLLWLPQLTVCVLPFFYRACRNVGLWKSRKSKNHWETRLFVLSFECFCQVCLSSHFCPEGSPRRGGSQEAPYTSANRFSVSRCTYSGLGFFPLCMHATTHRNRGGLSTQRSLGVSLLVFYQHWWALKERN